MAALQPIGEGWKSILKAPRSLNGITTQGEKIQNLGPSMSPNEKDRDLHEHCVACGPNNAAGLRLEFDEKEDGSVVGYFTADPRLEGYPGIVHVGIIATLLDSAMSHCLFKKGIMPLTGRLSIRYSCPIRVGTVVKLEGRIRKKAHKVFFLEAKAFVDGEKAASAEGRYMLRGTSEVE
jgi:acyl-coenzyme A thioesterase PaaI-like protein